MVLSTVLELKPVWMYPAPQQWLTIYSLFFNLSVGRDEEVQRSEIRETGQASPRAGCVCPNHVYSFQIYFRIFYNFYKYLFFIST